MCFSFLGGTDIIVAKDMAVALSGLSLFGGREVKSASFDAFKSSDNKSLNVIAIAILGSVVVRPPKDESK